jgi:hypothetical protein
MSDHSPLRQALDTAIAEANGRKLTMGDLTVLASINDPFRVDTPAGHRDGEWLAVQFARLAANRIVHLRGMHYILVTDECIKPDGTPYRNDEPDWLWLQGKAAKAARWLGYVPFDSIIDQRNAAPTITRYERKTPHPYLSPGRLDVTIPDVDDLEPYAGIVDVQGEQPYKLVLVGEKSSLGEVLDPIARRYGADLYLPTGCMSDTLIHTMAKVGAEDGRPMMVFYFADCDPSGWNMPAEVARKLQALQVGFYPALDFEVRRVALTVDQVREYGLPSTPLKDTEKRADKWRAATGVEQTELDALAALQPNLLRRIARDALDPFYDHTLDRRIRQAIDDWHEQAQAVVDANVDPAALADLQTAARARLDEMAQAIDELNEQMQLDPDGFDLPDFELPQAGVDVMLQDEPLISSGWDFTEQCTLLKRDRAYGGDG